MSIPIDDETLKWHQLQAQAEYGRQQLARRMQQDYAVFISYSHADRDVAQRLTSLFDERHIRYVIDEKALQWGDRISEWVQAEIARCTHYLLILSENSAHSQWCAVEYGIATGKGKIILVYQTDPTMALPAFAAPDKATADMGVVAQYFSRELIDLEEVDALIEEILDEPGLKLDEFRSIGGVADGRQAWDAPDRYEIERVRQIYEVPDRSQPVRSGGLVRIELGDLSSQVQLVLHYGKAGGQPDVCEIAYTPELRAAVIVKGSLIRKQGSDAVGVRETSSTGEVRYIPRTPSLQETLNRQAVYGWNASQDFWEIALKRLRQRLTG